MELARHLVRLTYYSRLMEPLPDDVVQDILEVSWRNNTRDHITGILYQSDAGFVQILEGDRIPVSLCYKRISQDPRHLDPIIMACSAIQARSFPDWPMRLIRETPAIRSQFPDHDGTSRLQPWEYSEPVLVEAIKDLVLAPQSPPLERYDVVAIKH